MVLFHLRIGKQHTKRTRDSGFPQRTVWQEIDNQRAAQQGLRGIREDVAGEVPRGEQCDGGAEKSCQRKSQRAKPGPRKCPAR